MNLERNPRKYGCQNSFSNIPNFLGITRIFLFCLYACTNTYPNTHMYLRMHIKSDISQRASKQVSTHTHTHTHLQSRHRNARWTHIRINVHLHARVNMNVHATFQLSRKKIWMPVEWFGKTTTIYSYLNINTEYLISSFSFQIYHIFVSFMNILNFSWSVLNFKTMPRIIS